MIIRDRKKDDTPRKRTEGDSVAEAAAEREGIKKGIEEGAFKGLRAVMEAKFGAEGLALVERLVESMDLARLDALTRAAALARSVEDIRAQFGTPNGHT